MRRKQKKSGMRKLLILIVFITFIFSLFKISNTFASVDTFEITGAEASYDSNTIDINNFKYTKRRIISDVTFRKLGDCITYSVKVKNNDDKSYIIKDISDDNENKYVTYTYEGCAGQKLNSKEEMNLVIKQKYVQEIVDISDREQDFSINITFILTDEDGNITTSGISINKDQVSDNKKEKTVKAEPITIMSRKVVTTDSEQEQSQEDEPVINLEEKVAEDKQENKLEEIPQETIKTEEIPTGKIAKATLQNPNTGDEINQYIFIAVLSVIMLKLLSKQKTVRNRAIKKYMATKNTNRHSRKKGTKLFSLIILGMLLIPTISKAMDNNLICEFSNIVNLKNILLVTYKIDENEYETTVKYGEKFSTIEEPKKDGYNFIGWQKEDGTMIDPNEEIKDDIYIIAKFGTKQFTIEYKELKGAVVNNPVEYDAETEDIELIKPSKDGYEFIGWTGTDLNGIVENVTIAKGSIGNRTYTANWKTKDYEITYHLNGGAVSQNPIEYNIESEDITLKNPTKEGYEFAGWTGTNLNEATKKVVIAKGSIENKEYTANWSITDFTISYEGINQAEKEALKNPIKYNIESEDIKLKEPEDRKDSDGDIEYKFVGWKIGETTSKNVEITKGSTGNKTYTAIWEKESPSTYTIMYDLKDGVLEEENRTSFTKYDTFTLKNPTKKGNTFLGWTGSNGTTPEKTVQISNKRENLNYTANWEEDVYTINYELDNGIVEGNPTTYTVSSEDIILKNPTKTGYTFKGWTGTNLTEKTMKVTIPHGSTESREYTANFEANKYEIVFDRNTGSGSMANQEMTYDVEASLNENLFTKDKWSFIGWNTKKDGTGTTYEDVAKVKNLETENGKEIVLYAQWVEGIAEMDGEYFKTIQLAVDKVKNNYSNGVEKTIRLLQSTEEKVTIPAKVNIVLDLQNYTLSSGGTGTPITNDGTLKIPRGTVTTSASSGVINNTGMLIVEDAKIIATGKRQAIYNNGGKVEITGNAYLSSETTERATVQNLSGGEIIIKSGKIVSNGQSAVENSGKLQIGVKDGNVNISNPTIIGKTNGIKASNGFDFYDGIIKGKTSAISDKNKLEDKEDGYEIFNEEIDGYKNEYLKIGVKNVSFNANGGECQEKTRTVIAGNPVGILPEARKAGNDFLGWFTSKTGGEQISENIIIQDNVTYYAHWNKKSIAISNGILYDSIKKAIDIAEDGVKTTVKLLQNTEETVKIPEGKDIVLDLDGHNLTYFDNSTAVITNRGNLEIKNGLIYSDGGAANIDNLATGNLKIKGTRIIATDTRQALYNDGGMVEISNNAYLESSSSGQPDKPTLERGTIQNFHGGRVTITSATVISKGKYGIANEATLIIGTKDGTCNTDSVIVKGEEFGIINIGNIKYYDGTIKGKDSAISGTIDETENNSQIIDDTEDEYKTVHLEIN